MLWKHRSQYCRCSIGSVHHKYIIRVERVLQSSNTLFILMEMCAGGDLFDYIGNNGGRLSEREGARIFKQLLQAVAYLHDQAEVAHCDIKLANIMFARSTPNSSIRLIDFGLSSRCNAGAVLTSRTGTTAFMAPEQIKQRYGTQVDLWSCGVVLFIMIFGYSPW